MSDPSVHRVLSILTIVSYVFTVTEVGPTSYYTAGNLIQASLTTARSRGEVSAHLYSRVSTALPRIPICSHTRRFGNISISRFLLNLREAAEKEPETDAFSFSCHLSQGLGSLGGSVTPVVFARDPDGCEEDIDGSAGEYGDDFESGNGVSSGRERVSVDDDGISSEAEITYVTR